MTVNEISSVDTPAVKGATAVIIKSTGMPIRKNAAEVASGNAEPLYKASDYGDAKWAGRVRLPPSAAVRRKRHCSTAPGQTRS